MTIQELLARASKPISLVNPVEALPSTASIVSNPTEVPDGNLNFTPEQRADLIKYLPVEETDLLWKGLSDVPQMRSLPSTGKVENFETTSYDPNAPSWYTPIKDTFKDGLSVRAKNIRDFNEQRAKELATQAALSEEVKNAFGYNPTPETLDRVKVSDLNNLYNADEFLDTYFPNAHWAQNKVKQGLLEKAKENKGLDFSKLESPQMPVSTNIVDYARRGLKGDQEAGNIMTPEQALNIAATTASLVPGGQTVGALRSIPFIAKIAPKFIPKLVWNALKKFAVTGGTYFGVKESPEIVKAVKEAGKEMLTEEDGKNIHARMGGSSDTNQEELNSSYDPNDTSFYRDPEEIVAPEETAVPSVYSPETQATPTNTAEIVKQASVPGSDEFNNFVKEFETFKTIVEKAKQDLAGLRSRESLLNQELNTAKGIRSSIEDDVKWNPLFWLGNLLGAIPKLRRGISPIEGWYQNLDAIVQSDPEYANTMQRIANIKNPSELEKIEKQIALSAHLPTLASTNYNNALKAQRQARQDAATKSTIIRNQAQAEEAANKIQKARDKQQEVNNLRNEIKTINETLAKTGLKESDRRILESQKIAKTNQLINLLK